MSTTLVTNFECQLSKADKSSDYKKLLDSLFETLVQLDSSMIEGRVVTEPERTETYDRLRAIAAATFQAFVDVDRSAADRWRKGLTVWRRPRDVDLSSWTVPGTIEAVASESVLPSDDELGTKLLCEATVLDDDGVVVIASRRALESRYSAEEFDYEFPKALLGGMAARELVAWLTGGEGEHAIRVEQVSDPSAFRRIAGPETTPEFVVAISDADHLRILPYSQFTFGCSGGRRLRPPGSPGDGSSPRSRPLPCPNPSNTEGRKQIRRRGLSRVAVPDAGCRRRRRGSGRRRVRLARLARIAAASGREKRSASDEGPPLREAPSLSCRAWRKHMRRGRSCRTVPSRSSTRASGASKAS